MRPIIPLTRISFSVSQSIAAHLRLGAFWGMTIIYIMGRVLVRAPFRGSWWSIVLDIACICIGNSISALWNDKSDQESDAINKRTHAWDETWGGGGTKLLWILTLLLIVLALTSASRALFIAIMVPLGLFYNTLKWSHKTYASLVLYALYYRAIPLVFGMGFIHISASLLFVVIAFFLLRVSSGLYKDLPDMKGDSFVGKRTFILVHGIVNTSLVSFVVWLLGCTLLVFGFNAHFSIWIVLLVLVAATLVRIQLLFHRKDSDYQKRYLARTFQSENMVAFGLLAAALILRA